MGQCLWLSWLCVLFPTPQVHGLNPVIGKFLYRTLIYSQIAQNTKIKKKEALNGPLIMTIKVAYQWS